MTTITTNEAVQRVRKNLDELGINESGMYPIDANDNADMDIIIGRTLPEAINEVNLAAPVQLLQGEEINSFSELSVSDGIVEFGIDFPVLRIVAFKAIDSDIVLSEAVPEASAFGLMQLNPYVRGAYDSPVLVQLQGHQDLPRFRYYSLHPDTVSESPIQRCSAIKIFRSNQGLDEYPISPMLYDEVMNRLTEKVLAVLGR